MRTLHACAVERDGTVSTDSDLGPGAHAILEKMGRVAYVLDQHRIAVARHSRTLADLRAELERIEGGQ